LRASLNGTYLIGTLLYTVVHTDIGTLLYTVVHTDIGTLLYTVVHTDILYNTVLCTQPLLIPCVYHTVFVIIASESHNICSVIYLSFDANSGPIQLGCINSAVFYH